MKIHYLQHVTFEGSGVIADWVATKGYHLSSTKLYEAQPLPNIQDYDILIVMGGPMSVHDGDTHAWLSDEKKHIKRAIDAGKYVLGICLGAQLIADVLGATVSPMTDKEIGWFPIAWHDAAMGTPLLAGLNPAMNVLHWHGEEFTIPEGAINLASSRACPNQAFLYNEKVLGLQFHLEMNEQSLDKIIENCGEEIVTPSSTVQSAQTIQNKSRNIASCESALFKILDNWLAEK